MQKCSMYKPKNNNKKFAYKTASNGGTAERNAISRTLSRKSCEMENRMRFFKETEMFEEIYKNEGLLTKSACRKHCLIFLMIFL